MILVYTVILEINNPNGVLPDEEIKEEYRSEIEKAVTHRREMRGLDGERIDDCRLTVDRIAVMSSTFS